MDIELYYGPPGTGKTTTLMDILEFELRKKKVRPTEIAFVTFTKKGAEEGISRAKEKFQYTDEDFPYFRTLHSMAFKAVGAQRRNVMDRRKYADFSKKMGMHFTGYYTEEFHHSDDMFLFGNDLYRNNPKVGKSYVSTLNFEKFGFVSNNYRHYKETFGYIDFTDMIESFVERGCTVPVKVAIIDEAQDLTTLQWKMVWTAFKHCERIYIAGDDDQAIYEWSGADVEYFLKLHGNIHILKKSYRLPYNFVKFASRITDKIKFRVAKNYEGREDKGDIDVVNTLEELTLNEDETYLILSRNNCFLKQAEEWVQKQGLPYKKKGNAVLTPEHIDVINFYENKRKTRIIDNMEEKRLQRIMKPEANLNHAWFEALNWPQELIDYTRTMVAKKPGNLLNPKINISTIHSIKGGEADNVFILSDITKNVKENMERNPDSEHRVFYVGATRAKKQLRLILPQTKIYYDFN